MIHNATPPGRFEVSMKVAVVQDELLLVLIDAETGVGDLPGGRIGAEEMQRPWPEAVRRELHEELGPGAVVHLSPEPVIAFPHRIASTGAPAIGLLWEGRLLHGDITLSDEHSDMLWIPLDASAARAHLSPTQGDAIARWLAARA